MRLFVAVEIGEEARAALAAAVEPLRRRFDRVRWERPEKYHVTVKFLGEAPPPELARVTETVDRASKGVAPFRADLVGLGAFPPRGTARVLWAGLALGREACVALAARVEDEAAAAGFPREDRPFHPHATIGRVRPPAQARALREAIEARGGERFGAAFDVARLVLLESRLDPRGSTYHEVHASALQG